MTKEQLKVKWMVSESQMDFENEEAIAEGIRIAPAELKGQIERVGVSLEPEQMTEELFDGLDDAKDWLLKTIEAGEEELEIVHVSFSGVVISCGPRLFHLEMDLSSFLNPKDDTVH